MNAGALNCPSCGAAVTQDTPNCPYCNARLQTVACSRCHGMMLLGTKFCPHCGGPAQPIAIGAEAGHACPRCNFPLTHIAFAQALAEECSRCCGLWMHPADFDRMCSDAEAQTAASGFAHIPVPPMQSEELYPRCPVCADRMSRQNFARRSGIMINICRAHGVWLDGDELRQVIEFIRAGGLDRARLLEKEQLEAARRKLARDRRDAPTPYAMPEPEPDPLGGLLRGLFDLWD
jgi:Zn-finger nucleic acid-binding protein